jgi:hypothetical protein
MIDERVARLRAELPPSDPGDPEMSSQLATFVQRGEDIEAELLLVVHGERQAHEVDQRQMKGWIKNASRMLGAAQAERDQRIKALGQAAIDSGITAEQFAEDLIARSACELETWAEEHGMSVSHAITAIEQMPPAERPKFGER